MIYYLLDLHQTRKWTYKMSELEELNKTVEEACLDLNSLDLSQGEFLPISHKDRIPQLLYIYDGNRDEAKCRIESILSDAFLAWNVDYELEEIDGMKASKLCRNIHNAFNYKNFISYAWNTCGMDIYSTLMNNTKFGKEKALEKAHRIMCSDSLIEEINRIYEPQNEQAFFGHPVHYYIEAASEKSARDIVGLIALCLYSVGRLKSRRTEYVNHIMDTESICSDFAELLELSAGATVAIEFKKHGNLERDCLYTSDTMAEWVSNATQNYMEKTLFFLVSINDPMQVCKRTIQLLNDSAKFVVIQEGVQAKEEARLYYESLIDQSALSKYKSEIMKNLALEEKVYGRSELDEIYHKRYQKELINYAYPAYAAAKCVSVTETKKNATSREKLEKLVGLCNVKELVNQIVAFYKMQEYRKIYQGKGVNLSRHMVFTGNPGTAKTTVARLLSEILVEAGVTRQTQIVECGRADLVGRYVGWTAKCVQEKFRDARGGILFIDEAYSLVDENNSYGDEAINTIVQEMENHRDDVIVIFAGYPKRMKEFLDKNEGLRSRIAFHIDFPNYSVAELMKIFDLMSSQYGFVVEKSAYKRVRMMINSAMQDAHFGNGRYVRNVIEQAMMKQSCRLDHQLGGKQPEKEELFLLKAEDFTQDFVGKEDRTGRVIGFSA